MVGGGSVVLNRVVRIGFTEKLTFEQRCEGCGEVRFECLSTTEYSAVPIIRSLALILTSLGDSGQLFYFFSYKIRTVKIPTQDCDEKQ